MKTDALLVLLGSLVAAIALALGACSNAGTAHAPDADPDEYPDSGTDTDSETDDETCVPEGDAIQFDLYLAGGFELVPGRGYELVNDVLAIEDWGTLLCSAELDDEQIAALLSSALAIDFAGLESSYDVAVDGMFYDLLLTLPPCTFTTRWGVPVPDDPSTPEALLDFAAVVESIGDPIAESCPDAGPDAAVDGGK